MTERRLDAELAERGLARSRTQARALIVGGLVTVDGRAVVKPAAQVSAASVVEVAGSDHYVSRAAHKLIAALDAFGVDSSDRVVLDAGASTGGFTQVLLERGARTVLAVDVGHGQLAPSLAGAPGLVLVEGCNVRHLDRATLAEVSGVAEPPTLVTADLSFISLTTVLPALQATATDDAEFVLLVKPQFEVGRSGIREGVVRDAGLRADAISGVLWAAFDLGLLTAGVISSPIAGSHGNVEALVHLSRTRGTNPTEWIRRIDQVAGGTAA